MNTEQAINRVRDIMRRQHNALSTEETYVFWLRRYMAALPKMPNGLSSEQKIERFLTALARDHGLSASSQNQAFNAILFFYKHVLKQTIGKIDALRAQRPIHMRHAPTVGETQALLQTIRNIGGYATHCLERGTNPRAIQKAMGHASLETTMGYLHAEALSVGSPLDTLHTFAAIPQPDFTTQPFGRGDSRANQN